jgi:hypothetical protein
MIIIKNIKTNDISTLQDTISYCKMIDLMLKLVNPRKSNLQIHN